MVVLHCVNSSSQRTPSLIDRYKTTENRSEMATILIGCFFFLLFQD
jgi:hypothetical protein